jgi:hypothetical protein
MLCAAVKGGVTRAICRARAWYHAQLATDRTMAAEGNRGLLTLRTVGIGNYLLMD